MKNGYLLIMAALLATACTGDEEKAAQLYAQAESYYNEGNYSAAQTWIDSIETSYPKAFGTIKEGMVLQCRINQKVYEHDLLVTDSLYNIARQELDGLKSLFELSRESEYQTERNYVYKKGRPGLAITGSGLRAQVTESGEFRLISIYNGNKGINHTGIRVKRPDGSYCETAAIAYDGARNYRFTDDGKSTEMITYKKSQCHEVAELIALSNDKKLTVQFTGGSNYSIPLDKNARLAIAETYRLSQALATVDSLSKRREYGIKQLELADAQLMKLESARQESEP